MTQHPIAFFFPDALDQLDRSFDFETETRSQTRARQRDDCYAHEVFARRVYDGLLISKGIVDSVGGKAGKYSIAQRLRLRRLGAREFFRLSDTDVQFMGDCGAFTYVNEHHPPFTVDEVLEFYSDCDVDLGLSVDHVITKYNAKLDDLSAREVPKPLRERQDITLQLAEEFFTGHRSHGPRFMPLGVAQGWSPRSYASAVMALQKMGYDYIALGGLVPLQTKDILATLSAVAVVRAKSTRFHLLGVTRLDAMAAYIGFGVVSLDSTSPLLRAFKDNRDNYYTADRTYMAIRVPQVGENTNLKRRIAAGEVSGDMARRLERACLDALNRYARDEGGLDETLAALRAYEQVHHPTVDLSAAYEEVLRDRPWTQCPCELCRDLGHHVILLRGAERNRGRGFHNLWTFYNRLLPQHDGSGSNDPPRGEGPLLTGVAGDDVHPTQRIQSEARS